VFFDTFEGVCTPLYKINKTKRCIFMHRTESQIMFQKCVCGSLKTEVRITESEQLVVCSECGKIVSKFQW
jgi:hypothetical protein